MDENAKAQVDGRRLRSEDSRRRIVQAVLELIEAGNLAPSGEQVALHAGVGLRSVFRHFRDMDSLFLEIGTMIAPRLQAMAQRPFQTETWQQQIAEIVQRRAEAYEALAPIFRAMHLHSFKSPAVQQGRQRISAGLRLVIQSRIPHGALDATAIDALDMILSFESWTRLRDQQTLSPDAARDVISRLVAAVLREGSVIPSGA